MMTTTARNGMSVSKKNDPKKSATSMMTMISRTGHTRVVIGMFGHIRLLNGRVDLHDRPVMRAHSARRMPDLVLAVVLKITAAAVDGAVPTC
jgi:hypothetical protein